MWLTRTTLIPLVLLAVLLFTGIDPLIAAYATATAAIAWKLGVDPEPTNTMVLRMRSVHPRNSAQITEDSYADQRPRYIIIDSDLRTKFDHMMLFGALLTFLWSVVMLFNRIDARDVYVSKLSTGILTMYIAYAAFWIYTQETPVGTRSVDLAKFRLFAAWSLGYLVILCLFAMAVF